MTLEEILQPLPPRLKANLREPSSNPASPSRAVELARPLDIDGLQILDPLAGETAWRQPLSELERRSAPLRLKQLTIAYANPPGTLASVFFVAVGKRPLELPGIGCYPALELGGMMRFPLLQASRGVLLSAGGKLHIGEFVFDAPIELPGFKIMASAERRKVDFERFRKLPLMRTLTQVKAAPPGTRFSEVFVELSCPAPGLWTVHRVAATNPRGAEELWSAPANSQHA